MEENTVLVRMLATASGPKGTYLAGQTARVDAATAAAWVAGGYAVYASPRQTATMPAGETAVQPPPRPYPAGGPVTRIKGIGPKTAAALAARGVETVLDLAAEDRALLAAETGLAEDKLEAWQDTAWTLLEDEVNAGNDAGNAAGG